jgi:hypothetical protein
MKYAGDKSLELYGSKRGIRILNSSTGLQVLIGILIPLVSFSLMVFHLLIKMRSETILLNSMSSFTGRMGIEDLIRWDSVYLYSDEDAKWLDRPFEEMRLRCGAGL